MAPARNSPQTLLDIRRFTLADFLTWPSGCGVGAFSAPVFVGTSRGPISTPPRAGRCGAVFACSTARGAMAAKQRCSERVIRWRSHFFGVAAALDLPPAASGGLAALIYSYDGVSRLAGLNVRRNSLGERGKGKYFVAHQYPPAWDACARLRGWRTVGGEYYWVRGRSVPGIAPVGLAIHPVRNGG